jgi:tetratricopeptide (TPR) repeat protein
VQVVHDPRPAGPAAKPVTLPLAVAEEIAEAAGAATRAQRAQLIRRAERAVAAYEAERFAEALRLAKQVLDWAPGVSILDMVAGLAAYRLGRWRDAARHLERYQAATGEQDLVPVLMDCMRALGRTARVGELWHELRRSSPGPEILAEARIVSAGSLADTGDLAGAIALLSVAAAKPLRNPAERHLRQWYALGDLYDRAGDVPRARELFTRVARTDPDAFDVHSRLQSLGGRVRSKRGRFTSSG